MGDRWLFYIGIDARWISRVAHPETKFDKTNGPRGNKEFPTKFHLWVVVSYLWGGWPALDILCNYQLCCGPIIQMLLFVVHFLADLSYDFFQIHQLSKHERIFRKMHPINVNFRWIHVDTLLSLTETGVNQVHFLPIFLKWVELRLNGKSLKKVKFPFSCSD